MEEIKRLTTTEIKEYVEVAANAFPLFKMNTPEEKEIICRRIIRSIETGFSSGAYGSFKDGQLVGGMRFYDFVMNMFNQKIIMGGIGLVAVALAHKKEKVCSRMIQFFLNHYHTKGVFLVGLFPFRPDFYKKMGFGFGNKTKQYQISPVTLPKGASKKSIRLLKPNEKQLIVNYYNRYMESHHGCIQLSEFEVDRVFEDNKKIAVYQKDGGLEGYIKFHFQPEQKDKYHIHVTELLFGNRAVLSELLCFLNSQSDQVEKILIDTHEEYFQFMCDNPANGEQSIFLHHQTNLEEIGIMYRVINNKLLFETLKDHIFGGVTLTVKLNIHDSYFSKNNESLIIHFEKGKPHLREDQTYQVEIETDIAEFSSLVMGVVPFSQLYLYSKADISDKDFIPVIDRLFATADKPICHTRF